MVVQKGMSPIYGQENIHRFFRSRFVPSVLKRMIAKDIFKKFGKSGFIIPVGLSVRDQRITISLTRIGLKYKNIESLDAFLDSMTSIFSGPSFSKYSQIPLCLVNHYHQYFYDWSDCVTRTESLKTWEKVLDLLNSLTFGWKTTFQELYDRATKMQKIRISKTGSKITIVNNSKDYSIANLSFLVGGQLEPNA